MELHGCNVEGGGIEGGEKGGEAVGVRDEDRVGDAFKAGEDVCTEVLGIR